MLYGAEQFKELFEKYQDRPIFLYGDPDCDGLFALWLMTKFCDMLGKTYELHVNEHRHHGFIYPIDKLKGKLVIAADFHITREEVEELVNHDVVLLSTDHHDIKGEYVDISNDKYGTEGIIINNQYYFEPEEDRYLSGAGVFYELISSLYPEFKCKLYEAIVGISLLTDVRATESEKAKAYLRTAFRIDPETPYIKYLIDNTSTGDYTFGMPRMDRNFIDYTLSPTINALLRYNKTQEAIDFILEKGLQRGNQYRQSQSDLMTVMAERVRLLCLSSVNILAILDTDFMDYANVELSDFIGLLCSNFKDKYGGKSVLGFTVANNKVTRASFRGKYDDIPYLSSIRQLIPNADGHQTAFGIKNFEPTQDLWINLNDLISDLESNHVKTVNILEVSNLAALLNEKGLKIAEENCYVRDCFRTYIKYIGSNVQIIKTSYKMIEMTYQDRLNGLTPDMKKGDKEYKYLLDDNGRRIPKFIEYLVDGRKMKSFGEPLEKCVILPILEKGYIQLYVKPFPE